MCNTWYGYVRFLYRNRSSANTCGNTLKSKCNCTSRIDKIYEKTSRSGSTLTFVEMVTDFRDPDGVLVAEAKMTAVETSE